MNINTNTWNKIRYTIYTPGYDRIVGVFTGSRKKSIEALNIQPDDKVLIVGAGTGLDLEFVPKTCEITATDITPLMIQRLVKRNSTLNLNVIPMVMDGQALDFPDNTFDFVILHLILAVIPDATKCISEVERVLKGHGRVAIFDKFVPTDRKVSRKRQMANVIANFLFSDITRHFESIVATTSLKVLSDESADFKGNFRLIQLLK